ncbi:LysM peptidoglycan-binding domain-containing protein [Gordonia hydrophobica]|uniref:LysM peptidoglycan-binding domain-containing protein n=1 Tax=Gordonia hydrophobica TaxID=40516 RepID=A0ABZ2U0I9_9ACTN|nr:LysM peptidoglycan-binding domain-containing protein [Gordonia hydrophobica]MBM7367693.1 hypothetical protein [Gordonia hydrophobica]
MSITATAPGITDAGRVRRSADARPSVPGYPSRMAMTCDLPVVDRDRVERSDGRPVRDVCRPTGRSESGRGARRVADRPDRRRSTVIRSDDQNIRERSVRPQSVQHRTVPDQFPRSFEHRWVGALVVGGLLAAMVWVVMIVGVGERETASAQTPAATSVVYVRAGESLTALAHRIAPELPAAGVIAQVRKLNGLETSGLTIGQALIVPDYR